MLPELHSRCRSSAWEPNHTHIIYIGLHRWTQWRKESLGALLLWLGVQLLPQLPARANTPRREERLQCLANWLSSKLRSSEALRSWRAIDRNVAPGRNAVPRNVGAGRPSAGGSAQRRGQRHTGVAGAAKGTAVHLARPVGSSPIIIHTWTYRSII